jgi:hypothetical protein
LSGVVSDRAVSCFDTVSGIKNKGRDICSISLPGCSKAS